METHKAWMALTAASLSLALATGCRETPEPISEVPPPAPSYEPQPLPPVTVSPPGGASDPYAPGAGGGYAEPEVIAPAPAPGPAGGGQTYTVRKGDTLWSIATRVYGNGQRWVDIAQANPSLDPQKMAVGQQIVLP